MRKFFKAFIYASAGIVHGLKTERNIKFHLVAAALVIAAGLFFNLSLTEWFIVLVLIGGMLSLELMNAAIERVVDLITEEYLPLARQAKDLAAGAVFVFAIVSAIIGLLLFVPKMLHYFQ
jgi:undecaprenol kinase